MREPISSLEKGGGEVLQLERPESKKKQSDPKRRQLENDKPRDGHPYLKKKG